MLAGDGAASHSVDNESFNEIGEGPVERRGKVSSSAAKARRRSRRPRADSRTEASGSRQTIHPRAPEKGKLCHWLHHTVDWQIREGQRGLRARLPSGAACVTAQLTDDDEGEEGREENRRSHRVRRECRDELSEGGEVCKEERTPKSAKYQGLTGSKYYSQSSNSMYMR